jgi:hypothetical protein
MQKTNRRKERGQALVEFALTLPILLMVLIGIIDLGRVFFTYAEASNSLRQALRQAPNIGFGSGTPSYRDCNKIEDIADNVRMTDVEIEIEYILSDNSTVSCNAVTDALLNNGDRMVITSEATIDLWVVPLPIEMNFVGQRTVIKTLEIGSPSSGDLDFDGLDNGWENHYFVSYTAENGLGDYDCDLVTNGAEEALGTNPTLPMNCVPAKPTVSP